MFFVILVPWVSRFPSAFFQCCALFIGFEIGDNFSLIGLPYCTPELERRQYAVAFKNWMKKRMHNSKLLFRAMVKRRWCECVLLIGQTRNLPHHKAPLTFFASVLAVLSPNSPWKVKAKAWKKPMPLIFHGLCTLWNLKIIGNLIKIYHTYFLAVSWKPSSKSARGRSQKGVQYFLSPDWMGFNHRQKG